jgi:hypothetical protein
MMMIMNNIDFQTNLLAKNDNENFNKTISQQETTIKMITSIVNNFHQVIISNEERIIPLEYTEQDNLMIFFYTSCVLKL